MPGFNSWLQLLTLLPTNVGAGRCGDGSSNCVLPFKESCFELLAHGFGPGHWWVLRNEQVVVRSIFVLLPLK